MDRGGEIIRAQNAEQGGPLAHSGHLADTGDVSALSIKEVPARRAQDREATNVAPLAPLGPYLSTIPRRITYDGFARSRYAMDARRADYIHYCRWHIRTFKRFPTLQEVANVLAFPGRQTAASLRDQCLIRGLIKRNEFGDLEVVRK